MALWSKALVCGRSLGGNVGSDPAWVMDVSCECLLSGRGLCDGLITPVESHRVWCV